ncbi:MAG: NUDIX domain-containing protein [Bdellovibrionota bacterium]
MERFRKGVVAVLRNAQREVLLCERSDHEGSWQFPQGGIEEGETPEQAFYRELNEELGNGNCRVLLQGAGEVRYRWPQMGRDGVHGQEQTWFLGEFISGGPELEKSDHCFRAWRWVSVEEALKLVVDFKRRAYEEGLASLGLAPEARKRT